MTTFRHKFLKLDQDQKDTLLSTMVIVAIALFISRYLILDLFLLPALSVIQGLVTFVFFARKPLKKKYLLIDPENGKRFTRKTGTTFWHFGFFLFGFCFFAAAISQHSSKFLEYIFIFSPLFITRSVVFFQRLPLSALYYQKPGTHVNLNTSSSGPIVMINTGTDSLARNPAFSECPGNIFH